MFDGARPEIRHSWITVQGVTTAALLAELGLETAGESDGVPDLGVAKLPDDWVVVVSADPVAAFNPPLAGLARHDTVVACAEDGRAMRTEARSYSAGEELWRVVCDPEDEQVLSFLGEPPPEYDALADTLGWDVLQETPQEEAAAALYDVPLTLALMACGLKLGAEPEGLRWTRLRRTGP